MNHRQIKNKEVDLVEDCAGGLCAICEGVAYCDLELTESTFSADAQAIIDGDSDWAITVFRDYIPEESSQLIATYSNGKVTIARHSDGEPVAGYSGREYLGLDQ
jgi:hypothetical protein